MVFRSQIFKCTLFRQLALATISIRTISQFKPAVCVPFVGGTNRISSSINPFNSRGFCYFGRNENRKVNVEHDRENRMFSIAIPGVGTAFLEYEKEGNLIRLTNTQVPRELAGRGLGTILAKAALEYIAQNDLKMKVECGFVQNFINKFEPKYNKYIRE